MRVRADCDTDVLWFEDEGQPLGLPTSSIQIDEDEDDEDGATFTGLLSADGQPIHRVSYRQRRPIGFTAIWN